MINQSQFMDLIANQNFKARLNAGIIGKRKQRRFSAPCQAQKRRRGYLKKWDHAKKREQQMKKTENKQFVEIVAAPLCGIAIAIIIMAMAVEIVSTLQVLSN